jgi:hypothetical protein
MTHDKLWWGLAIAVALLPGTVVAQKAPAQKKLYCWNENGKKVCGDALPPEQSAGARTEFSSRSGRTLNRVDRALTAEERALAETEAGRARLAADAEAARVRRDLAMVESYATEAELQRAFNERIVLVDESIKTSVLSEANLRRGLAGLLAQAANLELAGKPVAKPLQNTILKQHAELNRQVQILHGQRADRVVLDDDLAAALQRYRDLKAQANPAAAPAAAESRTE